MLQWEPTIKIFENLEKICPTYGIYVEGAKNKRYGNFGYNQKSENFGT